MEIVGPHFAKTGPRTAAQIHAETALMNDKVRKTPFGWRRKALVKEKVKYMEKLGMDSLEIEKNTTKTGLLSRLKNKLSMPPRVIRIIGTVIAVVFIGFLIWDIAAHGRTMSAGQLALGIINIVLEVAIVVVEILGLILPAVSIIPVIGQILMIAVLIVGIFVTIFGTTEHQKTPGEKFVDRMQASGGWLSQIDDPPEPLLTATVSSTSGTKHAPWSLSLTLKNDTIKTIKFSDAAPTEAGKDPSTDTINSVSLSFFGGTDDANLFANTDFAGEGEKAVAGGGTWRCSGFPGGAAAWDVALQKPNGTSLRSTNLFVRIRDKAEQTGAALAPGEKIEIKIEGTLGAKAGTSMVTVVEKRPGAPFAPSTFEITRN